MTVDIAYFDSSALVKTLMREPESAALRRFMRTVSIKASCTLTVTEVLRAVRRFDVTWTPRAQAMLQGLAILDLSDDVFVEAGMVDPPELRTLDAVHLASAKALGNELAAVVTYDVRMAAAAARLGLPVEAPS